MSSNSGYKYKSRTHSSSSASGYLYKSKSPPPSLPPDMIAKIVGHASAVTNKSVIRLVSKFFNQDQHHITALLNAPKSEQIKVFKKACEYGKLNYVKILVANGIDPAVNDNYAIRLASQQGHLDVVKFLASHPGVNPADSNNRAIIGASTNGHLAVVKFLASLPIVDPTAINNRAIDRATYQGHFEVFKFLASIHSVDSSVNYNNLIKIASDNNYPKIVKYLIEYKNVRPSDDIISNAKEYADVFRYPENIELVNFLAKHYKGRS